MASDYTDTPYNMEEITPWVITDKKRIAAEIFESGKCYFYDTCSFRWHAKLSRENIGYLLRYIKTQNGIIIITRCILMELASHSGLLEQRYIEYIEQINKSGISVLVIFEEDLFSVMSMCFSTNNEINNYLCWAVRTLKSPTGTVGATLEKNRTVYDEVIKGKNSGNGNVFQRFFRAVRAGKEAEDNLGEELLAICLNILSYLPGEEDGKFCVITDDKGGIGKIDALFRETSRWFRGKKIGIFSTPKLVQVMYRAGILEKREDMETILCTGTSGNIAVLGMLVSDIRSSRISLAGAELADLIGQPNGIHIIF